MDNLLGICHFEMFFDKNLMVDDQNQTRNMAAKVS